MALDVTVDTATQIIDMTRERGVHSMATPADGDDRMELCEKIVNACRAVYRGGEGNAEDTVLNVLRLVGDLEDNGEGDAEITAAQIEAAEVPAPEPESDPDPEPEPEPAAEAAQEPEAAKTDDDDDEDEELAAARKAAEDAQEAAAAAEKKAAERKAQKQKEAEEQKAAEDEKQAEVAAAEPEPAEAEAAPKKRSRRKSATATVGGDPENTFKEGALERLLATGLPMPKSDAIENVPDPLPSDITVVTDVGLRKLHWQRHALRGHARWLLAKCELDEHHNQRILDDMLGRKVSFLRPDAPRESTAGELRALAREKDSEIGMYMNRAEKARAEVGLLRALVTEFDDDCAVLSRELTARLGEKESTPTPVAG